MVEQFKLNGSLRNFTEDEVNFSVRSTKKRFLSNALSLIDWLLLKDL